MIKKLNNHQDNLFEDRYKLNIPTNTNHTDLLIESKQIVEKAIIDNKPYAVGIMLSGGDDSITALQVAIMLGVKIDFIMHGVTGTGLKDCRKYVQEVSKNVNIPLIEADAGSAFEDYVKRKGFFGKGKDAHKFSYHILKTNPFEKALSKNIIRGQRGKKILLLNGVRVEESDNRMDNFGDNPYRTRNQQIWVNIIHWWSKKECLELLDSEGVKRSPVAIALGRSGECNCGTMQNEADRITAAEYDPEWKEWMWDIRKFCISKFGWDIGQNPSKKRLAELKQESCNISDDMPMCVGCKSRQNKLML